MGERYTEATEVRNALIVFHEKTARFELDIRGGSFLLNNAGTELSYIKPVEVATELFPDSSPDVVEQGVGMFVHLFAPQG